MHFRGCGGTSRPGVSSFSIDLHLGKRGDLSPAFDTHRVSRDSGRSSSNNRRRQRRSTRVTRRRRQELVIRCRRSRSIRRSRIAQSDVGRKRRRWSTSSVTHPSWTHSISTVMRCGGQSVLAGGRYSGRVHGRTAHLGVDILFSALCMGCKSRLTGPRGPPKPLRPGRRPGMNGPIPCESACDSP